MFVTIVLLITAIIIFGLGPVAWFLLFAGVILVAAFLDMLSKVEVKK